VPQHDTRRDFVDVLAALAAGADEALLELFLSHAQAFEALGSFARVVSGEGGHS